jgi:hypothetical protein
VILGHGRDERFRRVLPLLAASADEALGMAGELSSAGQRAEEVRRVVDDEPSVSVIAVDGHAADRVDREPAVGDVPLADCRDQFDGITDVA